MRHTKVSRVENLFGPERVSTVPHEEKMEPNKCREENFLFKEIFLQFANEKFNFCELNSLDVAKQHSALNSGMFLIRSKLKSSSDATPLVCFLFFSYYSTPLPVVYRDKHKQKANLHNALRITFGEFSFGWMMFIFHRLIMLAMALMFYVFQCCMFSRMHSLISSFICFSSAFAQTLNTEPIKSQL
jgi:hypothetical protein